MNPIMQGLNQPAQPQQGIASLAPTQPSQPILPQKNTIQDNNPSPINRTHGVIPGTGYAEGTGPLDPVAKIDDPLRFNQVTAPGNIPDRYKEGFVDFYKQNPDDFMRMGGQAISYVNTPQGERIRFGDTGSADNFRRYLESIGESPIPDQFSPLSQQPLPMGQHPLMGMPGVQQPGMGNFDHLTDNPYAAGPPDDFITIEGVRHYVGGAQQATPPQPPTAPPLTQTAPPQGNLGIFPGGNPGFDESSKNPYGINQGIASLAGTNPGI